jgi:Tfp pilus assembly protein PilV
VLIIPGEKGITLVESLIAAFLTMAVIVGLMTMQSVSWQTAGKSDATGRAVGILQAELESLENDIMRGHVPGAKSNEEVSSGSFPYFVTTTVSEVSTNKWLINVRVTWSRNARGVTSSMIVARQMGFNSEDNL